MRYRYEDLGRGNDTSANRMKYDARCPVAHCTPVEAEERGGGWWLMVCERGHRFYAKRHYTHVECRTKSYAVEAKNES
jgi:hypothetical protein